PPSLSLFPYTTLFRSAFAFMRREPLAWLRIEGQKLWYLAGNHEFVHDYDWYGERELLGNWLPLQLPFGVLLALGVLGLAVLLARSEEHTSELQSQSNL